ncbi:MAG: nucleotidyltransferase family protein, partial [Isosphaeraceae bacterium]
MSVTTTMTKHGITLPMERIVEFCHRWKVRELAVFSSFLRDDFDTSRPTPPEFHATRRGCR